MTSWARAPRRALRDVGWLPTVLVLLGVIGFPLIAGNLIVSSGIQAMLHIRLLLAVAPLAIVLFRVARRARNG